MQWNFLIIIINIFFLPNIFLGYKLFFSLLRKIELNAKFTCCINNKIEIKKKII